MNQSKKEEIISNINSLLKDFNRTLGHSDIEIDIKKEIIKAYISINDPENVKDQYKEIPEALSTLNNFLMKTAVSKKYHFSPEQDKIIHEYGNVYSGSYADSLGAVFNAMAFFHP